MIAGNRNHIVRGVGSLTPEPALLCRGRAGRNYVHSYLLNCFGTRNEPYNPGFTVARPQLNLGQPHPYALSVRGLGLQHKIIQHELQHEKPLGGRGQRSFVKFAKEEALGHKVFSVPFCLPSRAPSTLLYAPPHIQPRPQSNQMQKLLHSGIGGGSGGSAVPGSLVSELDCCSCVALDKLVPLLGFSHKNI